MEGLAETHRRLAALTEIASGRKVTQRSLASRLGISLGLANALLRGLEKEGLVAVNRSAGSQALRYAVTRAGRAELSVLAKRLATEAGVLLRELRAELQRQAGRMTAMGARRVLLCGNGLLADMIASAVLNAGMKLVGAVSPDVTIGAVAGVQVRPLTEAKRIACDAAVAITERDVAALRSHLRRSVPVIQLLSDRAATESNRGL